MNDLSKNKASDSSRQVAEVIAERHGADVTLATLSVKTARKKMEAESKPRAPRSRRGVSARHLAARS